MNNPVVAFVGSRGLDARYRVEVEAAVRHAVTVLRADIWTGDCPTGVDAWVREYCGMLGVTPRVFVPHRDDIVRHGIRAALAMRSERIADTLNAVAANGADVLLRAWSNPTPSGEPTKGTARATNRAKRYGLPVRVEFRGEVVGHG